MDAAATYDVGTWRGMGVTVGWCAMVLVGSGCISVACLLGVGV